MTELTFSQILLNLKGIVHPKMRILSLNTRTRVVKFSRKEKKLVKSFFVVVVDYFNDVLTTFLDL